jgi:SOS response regulatory protein OraA/RecX
MPETPSPALADALRRLKTAERTEAELRENLSAKHSVEDVEVALAWLKGQRLLSETRAVEATVRPRSSGRRAEGDVRLRARLEARGADQTAAEKALAELPDEASRMQEALAAKFSPEEPGQRGKAGRFLLSRGFDEEGIESALDRFFLGE